MKTNIEDRYCRHLSNYNTDSMNNDTCILYVFYRKWVKMLHICYIVMCVEPVTLLLRQFFPESDCMRIVSLCTKKYDYYYIVVLSAHRVRAFSHR